MHREHLFFICSTDTFATQLCATDGFHDPRVLSSGLDASVANAVWLSLFPQPLDDRVWMLRASATALQQSMAAALLPSVNCTLPFTADDYVSWDVQTVSMPAAGLAQGSAQQRAATSARTSPLAAGNQVVHLSDQAHAHRLLPPAGVPHESFGAQVVLDRGSVHFVPEQVDTQGATFSELRMGAYATASAWPFGESHAPYAPLPSDVHPAGMTQPRFGWPGGTLLAVSAPSAAVAFSRSVSGRVFVYVPHMFQVDVERAAAAQLDASALHTAGTVTERGWGLVAVLQPPEDAVNVTFGSALAVWDETLAVAAASSSEQGTHDRTTTSPFVLVYSPAWSPEGRDLRKTQRTTSAASQHRAVPATWRQRAREEGSASGQQTLSTQREPQQVLAAQRARRLAASQQWQAHARLSPHDVTTSIAGAACLLLPVNESTHGSAALQVLSSWAASVEVYEDMLLVSAPTAAFDALCLAQLPHIAPAVRSALLSAVSLLPAATPLALGCVVMYIRTTSAQLYSTWQAARVLSLVDSEADLLQAVREALASPPQFGCSTSVDYGLLAVGACGMRAAAGAVLLYAWNAHAREWATRSDTTLHPSTAVLEAAAWNWTAANFGARVAVRGYIISITAPGFLPVLSEVLSSDARGAVVTCMHDGRTGSTGGCTLRVGDDSLTLHNVSANSNQTDSTGVAVAPRFATDAAVSVLPLSLLSPLVVSTQPRTHGNSPSRFTGVGVYEAGDRVPTLWSRSSNAHRAFVLSDILAPPPEFASTSFGASISLGGSVAAIGSPSDASVYVTTCTCAHPGSCSPSDGFYRQRLCTAGSCGSCAACTRGRCADGWYEARPCTTYRDRVCLPCSDAAPCPPGRVPLTPCTPTRDRICGPADNSTLELDSTDAAKLSRTAACLQRGACAAAATLPASSVAAGGSDDQLQVNQRTTFHTIAQVWHMRTWQLSAQLEANVCAQTFASSCAD
ncbi:MAG: hypothetical protein EOO41_00820, partial [Methanobacteriota archaeon]